MTLSKSLLFLFLSGSISFASSLQVYQDQALYNYIPKDSFIGFTKNVKAKCEGDTLSLLVINSCPKEKRLCKILNEVQTSEQRLQAVRSNIKVLSQLISLPKPNSFNASSLIDTAKQIGEEQAKLSNREKILYQDIVQKQKAFEKQAPSLKAIKTNTICQKELKLTIPRGYISFSTNYEADIQEKEITVTQKLSIINQSGIDITADIANFYYRSAHQYINPIHFNPWIVSKYTPIVQKRMMYQAKKVADTLMVESESMADNQIESLATTASYEDAREYKIKDLFLPSTGIPLDIEVLQWKAPLVCEIKAYPYRNSHAFHLCSFQPKFQIDSNRWRIKEGKQLINENAVGKYHNKKYVLYTKVDKDIKIVRKPIVKKERESGIFGGTVRKKDGFTLTVTNKSDKNKSLILVDRIPTSTTDEIKVKLLSVNSNKKVDYKMLKEGKIEMKLGLAPNETKKIEVLFEISYDKELKVMY